MQIQFMTNYLIKGDYQGATEVPDPFHGGPEGFEKVAHLPCMLCHHAMPRCAMLVMSHHDPRFAVLYRVFCLIVCTTLQELAAPDVSLLKAKIASRRITAKTQHTQFSHVIT